MHLPRPVAAALVSALVGCAEPSMPPPAPPPPPPSGPEPVARGVDLSDTDLAVLDRSRRAAKLGDGRVLSAGGDEDSGATDAVELFDPTARKWAGAPPMSVARQHHAVTNLPRGRVLVCGGDDGRKTATGLPKVGKTLETCEIYDVASGRWKPTAPMKSPRRRFTLTTLGDGRVLAVGDPGSEVFDSSREAWSAPLATAVGYVGHAATLLADGRVLVVGSGGQPLRGGAEIFDQQANQWLAQPQPTQAIADHTATLLPDGSVLVVGGASTPNTGVPYPLAFAAVFEPKQGRWNVTGQPHTPHWKHAAHVLPSGDVLVAFGRTGQPELYTRELWKDVPPALLGRLEVIRPSAQKAGSSSGPGR